MGENMARIKTSDVVNMVKEGLRASPFFVRYSEEEEMGETYITVILRELDGTRVSVRVIVECPEEL